jgi:hypothetical protein
VLADQYGLHTTSIDKQEADEPLLTPASPLTALNAETLHLDSILYQNYKIRWRGLFSREPTSGLEPLTCLLRVIHQALQGFAQVCKSRISKGGSLLWVAACCTVLRSRWCQSGVNIGIAASRSCLLVGNAPSTSAQVAVGVLRQA